MSDNLTAPALSGGKYQQVPPKSSPTAVARQPGAENWWEQSLAKRLQQSCMPQSARQQKWDGASCVPKAAGAEEGLVLSLDRTLAPSHS